MNEPSPSRQLPKRFRLREPFCGISHGVGAALSAIGLVALLILARGRPWHTVAFLIYGASLIVLYTASALYHSLSAPPRQERTLQLLDHIAIFLLIAGTYTPLCLITLRGTLGWAMLGVEYGLAALGIAGSLFWKRYPDWLRVVIYLVMGWLVVPTLPVVRHFLPPEAIGWLVAGGLTYSVGTVIFATDWPHLWPGRFRAHDLWHLFVLGGSACHYVLVVRFMAAA